MSIEQKIDELSAKLDALMAKLEHVDQATASTTTSTTTTQSVGDVSLTTTEQTVVKGGGAVVGAQVLTMLPKAVGASVDDFRKAGWSDDAMIAQGYAEMAAPTAAATYTSEELDALLIAKATEMGDQGAAIFTMLKAKFGVVGCKELDPAKYGLVVAEIGAL